MLFQSSMPTLMNKIIHEAFLICSPHHLLLIYSSLMFLAILIYIIYQLFFIKKSFFYIKTFFILLFLWNTVPINIWEFKRYWQIYVLIFFLLHLTIKGRWAWPMTLAVTRIARGEGNAENVDTVCFLHKEGGKWYP